MFLDRTTLPFFVHFWIVLLISLSIFHSIAPYSYCLPFHITGQIQSDSNMSQKNHAQPAMKPIIQPLMTRYLYTLRQQVR